MRPDPYRVWLSEIMLQQTTVRAAGPYFERFTQRWPSLRELAAAEDADVMAAWAGLGYYSRVRNLLACARSMAATDDASFPRASQDLAGLPGIGAYTSAAIAALAFDEPVAVVDGNVERVIARVFAIDMPMPAGKEAVRARLQPLVPQDRPGEFAEALMDLGATICTPRKPACAICPWFAPCASRQSGRQAELPVRAPRKPRPRRYGTAYVARRTDGAVLLRRRPPRGLLGGMAEVPGSVWQEERSAPCEPPLEAAWMQLPAQVAHTFTHFDLQVEVCRAEIDAATAAPPGHWWAPAATLSGESLPSVMRKIIEAACPGATTPLRQAS